MKGGTVQISWHESKPVLTLDFHPLSATLATAGADFDIKVPLSLSLDVHLIRVNYSLDFIGFLVFSALVDNTRGDAEASRSFLS